MIYHSANPAVLARVPEHARRVLDVGCGTGALGAAIKSQRPCEVVGITHSAAEADHASRALDQVLVADLERFEPDFAEDFDCIVCSHVLEHLSAPDVLLGRLRPCLSPGGTLLVALPNLLHWKQRLQLMRGRFRYTDGGLMDRTHLRFYDWHSARELALDAGLDVDERMADGSFPLARHLGTRLSAAVDRFALRRWPGLFGFQFVLSCRPAAATLARGG